MYPLSSPTPSKSIFLALLSGAAMPFAFSPYNHVWLAILSISVLTWLIQGKQPFLTAYSFGFAWFGLGAWWLAPTFHHYGGLSWPSAILIVITIGLIIGLFPAVWAWGSIKIARYNGKPYALLLALSCSIIGIEWLRGHLFTGIPWTSMGNLVLNSPASPWLSVFGVYGMAFLPVLLAASIALLWQSQQRYYAIIGIILSALFILLSPALPQANGPEYRVALIQPNISQDKKWDSAFLNQSMQRLVRLSSEQANNVDLIIWPEAAIPFYLERSPSWSRWFNEHLQTWQKPVLFGGLKLLSAPANAQNGLFLFNPQAPMEKQFVGKHHLVPFGEYVPSWLPWLHKIVADIGNFQEATDQGVLHYQTSHFGSLICYESIFPEESRQRVLAGANVLIVVTNDAWYDHSPAAWQHLQAAQVRAIETGRYVLRTANTGISAIIAPNGNVTTSKPWWTTTSVIGTYHTSTITTSYQIWGDTPALSIFMILLAWLLFFRKRSHGL